MRPLALAIPLAMPFLGGCFKSAFDGTWLFTFDPEPATVSGTCAEHEDTTTSLGTSYDLVDIYTNSKGGIVVLMEMALQGSLDGKQFTASAVEEYGDIDYENTEGVDMDGVLAKGVLTGRVTTWWLYEWSGNVEDCSTAWDYTAERIDSDPDDYVDEE